MINNCTIMGRLTREPELKSTSSGIPYTRFTVAVDREYKSGGERKTDFIDCVAWRSTAEFIDRNFSKGSLIAIEGSIMTDTYTDRNGSNRKAVEISVSRVSFTGEKATPKAQSEQKAQAASFEDGDLPFDKPGSPW